MCVLFIILMFSVLMYIKISPNTNLFASITRLTYLRHINMYLHCIFVIMFVKILLVYVKCNFFKGMD